MTTANLMSCQSHVQEERETCKTMSGADFILCLLTVSEKAAAVARKCRQNCRLLSLLVQEKATLERNTHFVADFKTLADVLIQELIRHDIEKKFPSLKGFVNGEEENVFTNALGETVMLVLNEDKSNTMVLLTKILNGDVEAARSLSDTVHEDIPIENISVVSLPKEIPNLNIDDLALWIDPIDSTTEYINGSVGDSDSVPCKGLACVTVLIGAFSRTTGLPVVGVINQPFFQLINCNNSWKGRCFWGFSQNGHHMSSIPEVKISHEKPLIAVSSFEDENIKKKLRDAGFDLVSPAGAGNKCLGVILGKIDAYVLSQKSTYYWDTCGCHALLKSLQGNIWNYQEALKGTPADLRYRVKYSSFDIKEYSNKCGLIAYRNEQIVRKIVDILK